MYKFLSFDLDGCIFWKSNQHNVVADNKHFLDTLGKGSKDNEYVVFIGSNRQSYSIDVENAQNNNTPSI